MARRTRVVKPNHFPGVWIAGFCVGLAAGSCDSARGAAEQPAKSPPKAALARHETDSTRTNSSLGKITVSRETTRITGPLSRPLKNSFCDSSFRGAVVIIRREADAAYK